MSRTVIFQGTPIVQVWTRSANNPNDNTKLNLEPHLADLAPTYEAVCAELGWSVDAAKLAAMQAVNVAHLATQEPAIADAEENMGDIEIRDARLAKADYLCKLGAHALWLQSLRMNIANASLSGKE